MASFDAVKDAFVEFVENVPFYGAALLCVDHPEVQSIIPRLRDRRVVTYGFAGQADVRGENVVPVPGGNRFDVSLRAAGRRAADDRGHRAADARAAQCPERARRDRRAAGAGHRRRGDRPRLRPASPASSGASPRSARSTARPSSTITATIRSRSARCSRPRAKAARGAGDRGRPAAPLHPPARPDGRVPGRVQRCRHRARRAGLCGRRGADRGRRPRGAGRGAEAARPSAAKTVDGRPTLPPACATSPRRATW